MAGQDQPNGILAVDHEAERHGQDGVSLRHEAPQHVLMCGQVTAQLGDNVAAAHPDKEMLRLCSVRCPHMNEITMEDTLNALKLNRYVIEVPEEIRVRAARAVERMIAIG